MRKLAYGVLALAAVLLVVVASAVAYVRSGEPDLDGEARVAGLRAPVDVWRDSMGVPHVWAADEADLFRAMGYVHAQDRLWQMELFRRVADGRMAEIMGADLVDTDRFLRTLGMGRAAGEVERRLSADQRAALQAYADGVNQWIRDHDGPLPPEFLALRFTPEPWTVRNSISIGKIMAWDLSDWRIGLDLQRAVDVVGAEKARDLAPAYPDWGVNILGADAQWRGKGEATPMVAPTPTDVDLPGPISRVDRDDVPLPDVPPRALALLEGVSIAHASNSWVVGGARTRSGKPILANDMHLSLRAPSLWYLAALHGGDFDVAGMTLPGVPVVIAGHSRAVAWGYTNAMVDDTDFFVEEVDPADSTRYRTPDGWAPFAVRAETIQVKGADPVVHRVRTTRHGPVLSDVRASKGRVLAMRWTAHDPTMEVLALVGMNRARSAAEFLQALPAFANPHQNVVFADTAGTFGYWMGGSVPVRRGGDGLLPVPGGDGSHDWERYLEFDEKPHVLNPAEGFVVTANNRQLGAEYPHRISSNWFPPYRAMRIRQLVEAAREMTAADAASQQMDVRDLMAVRNLPHAVRAAELAGEADALRMLHGWNGEASMDSRPAAVFYTWFEILRRKVGADEYGDSAMYFPRTTLENVLAAGASPWVDDVTTPQTETLDALSAEAMRQAVREVHGRRWGQVHQVRIEHALGVVNLLDRSLGLNIGPFSAPGSPNTVNVAGYGGRLPPYISSYGPSQRHVVDMAAVDDEGGFVIPTGQSGLPFADHYKDQTPLWRQGRLWRIPLDRAKAEARVVHRLRLVPSS